MACRSFPQRLSDEQVHRKVGVAAIALTVVFMTILSAFSAAAEPPKMTQVFPAGLARGETVSLTATGEFPRWPVKVWVDRPGLEIKPAEKKGELGAIAGKDASCGVYWFRLYDEQGASGLRPLIVDNLPSVSEAEPNNEPSAPQEIAPACVVHGRLEKSGDVDTFAVELKQGEMLVASLQASHVIGSPMDGVLQICNSEGFVLHQVDDERGTDPLTVFSVPADGRYLVRVFAFPAVPNSTIGFAGGPTFIYRLTATTGGFVDHAMPLAVNAGKETQTQLFGWNLGSQSSLIIPPTDQDQPVQVFGDQFADCLALPVTELPQTIAIEQPASEQRSTSVELPVMITGRIDHPGDEDTYQFNASKGQKISLKVESQQLGFPLDAVLEIRDASGKSLNVTDDVSQMSDPEVTYTIPADGVYSVTIRDAFGHGGFRYVYRMSMEEARPDFGLTLAGDLVSVEAGKSSELSITVNRRNGFAEPIEIRVEGLPDTVTLSENVSAAKGDTAKTVKLKLTATADAAAFSGPIHVVGASDKTTRRARFTVAETGRSHHAAWLTVLKP